MNKYLCFSVALIGFAPLFSMAHDDLDLGIESVSLDKNCKAQVVVKNYGHTLPDSFYATVNPAYIKISKGEGGEALRSLRALDRHQKLREMGGSITITSKLRYENNPQPIALNIHYAEEFGDYGAGNNKHLEPMDCVRGKGQIAGAPIVYTQPDVAVTDARIDPKKCKIMIELSNVTGIALDKNAWHRETGVGVMQLNLDTHQRMPDIPLIDLDPNKTFGNTTQQLQWESDIPFKGANKMRIGLWRVLGDLDFTNNTIELAVPNACDEEAEQP